MDVRCERCRAQYVFEDDQITPAGLTVQCNACGHVFRVQKKELVVTRSVTPGELDEPPVPASSATPPRQHLPPPAPPPAPAPPLAPAPVAAPPPAADATSHWTIRQASGQSLSFSELNTLQRWIVERKVSREDEVTQGDGAWVRLGTLAELQSFFEVVEAADRAHGRSTSRYPPAPYPPPNYAPPPQYAPPAPAPAYVPPPPGYGPPPAYAPPPAPSPAAPQPPPPRTFSADSVQIELDEADLRAVGKSKGPRSAIVVVLLLLVAGAAVAYVFMPALFGRAPPPKPEPVAVPLTITMKTPEPPAPPPPPPEPTPEPPAAKAPEPTPEAKPKPKAASLKQQLAEAKRLRENNKSEQALDIYGRITAEDPENVEALAGRGLCYFDLEQYAPAQASLQEALRLSPTQGDALLGLAETYRAMGRKAEAIAMFERYLAAYPGGDEAAVARNAINQLKE